MEQNYTSVVIEQPGEEKKRGALPVLIAIAFVAMLGIGSTFAYMTWTGNQTPNRFTADNGLEVDLVEPSWTNAVNTQAIKKWPNVASDGSTVIPAAANDFKTYNSFVAKDPYVVNTSTVGNEGTKGAPAYVGIRLTFQKWVCVENKGGIKDQHKENGYYTTMSQEEVEALLNAYAFSQEATVGQAAAADGSTTAKDADGNLIGGVYANSDWTQISASGSATSGEAPQMIFVYNKGIAPVEDAITGNYPDAGNADGTATTTLFNNVTCVDKTGDYVNTLNGLIKGSSTDPGWRVLVDTAAINCTATDLTKSPFEEAGTSGLAQLVKAFPEVREDGKSPEKNAYVNAEKATQGSGTGINASNVPESYWGWTGASTETNWKVAAEAATE